jgi:hypothetical protein
LVNEWWILPVCRGVVGISWPKWKESSLAYSVRMSSLFFRPRWQFFWHIRLKNAPIAAWRPPVALHLAMWKDVVEKAFLLDNAWRQKPNSFYWTWNPGETATWTDDVS